MIVYSPSYELHSPNTAIQTLYALKTGNFLSFEKIIQLRKILSDCHDFI